MDPAVKIVTDSTAYLEPETVKRYDIRVVPIRIAFGSELYAEGVDIRNEEFYRRLISGSSYPTTSQPSVGELVNVYSALAGGGHPVLSIHISSMMSGTVGAAQNARASLPEARIEVVDARTLAMGMLVEPAAAAAERGASLSSLKSSVESLNAHIHSVGMFDTLRYAWKGGRIGSARSLMGTVLKIKPVLTIEDMDVRVVAKPRTFSGAVEHILGFVEKRAGQGRLHGWLAHAHIGDKAEALDKELRAHFDWAGLRLFELGPVFATHMGPGFIGLGFYSEADWKPLET